MGEVSPPLAAGKWALSEMGDGGAHLAASVGRLMIPLNDLCAPRPLQPELTMTNEVQQAREALGYRLGDIRKDARVSGRQAQGPDGLAFHQDLQDRARPLNAVEMQISNCGASTAARRARSRI